MFAVKQVFWMGADNPCKTIRSDFPRASAALAWLIDDTRRRGRTLFYEWDPATPGCADIVVFAKNGMGAEQFLIEPAGE